MIKKCNTCSNKPHTQDELHGKGNRVHNEVKKQLDTEYRCTVCGASTKSTDAVTKK